MKALVPCWATLILAATLVGCGGRDGSPAIFNFPAASSSTSSPSESTSPTPTPSEVIIVTPNPPPAASPTQVLTPTPTPAPPALIIEPAQVAQGEAALIRLTGSVPASNVRLSFADTQYTMIREGSGWWAVIGIGALFQRGDYTLTATWQGGSISTSLTVLDGGFTRESLTLPPGSSALLTDPARIQDERFLLASIHATFTPERFWNGRFLLPAQAPVTDPFGLMRSINGGAYLPHSGTDLAGDEGDLVIAAASGRVALARELYLYGNSVIIDHGGGVFTGYHHLSQIVPTEGESINAGDLVGTVGETGLVTGPHLHWELVVHGVRIDPLPWTRREITP